MKCPDCKNEVARLIQRDNRPDRPPEGLCVTCDAVECASEGESLQATRDRILPAQNKVKRKYTRREKPGANLPPNGGKSEAPAGGLEGLRKKVNYGAVADMLIAPSGGLESIALLRIQYQEEFDAAETAYATAKLKLETLEEIMAALRGDG